MPCKHEGGSDGCRRNKYGHCRNYLRRQSSEYRAKYIENGSSFIGIDRGKATFIGEALVQVDLSRRGWEVTVPVSRTALHDLHVEIPSVGWIGVQVRVGRLNTKTQKLIWGVYKGCKSPLLAVIHPPTGRIDYRRGTKPVPKELR